MFALLAISALCGLPHREAGINVYNTLATVALQERIGFSSLMLASGISLVNAIQLLPILPLEGGHIQRSLLVSARNNWSSTIVIAISVVGALALLMAGAPLFALIIGMGAVVGLGHARSHQPLPPMTWQQRCAIGTAFTVIACIHLYAIALVFGPGGLTERDGLAANRAEAAELERQ